MENRVFAGRYRVTEKIGIGGMAEVFKAQDETLGRTVAVKTMLPQYASDPTFAARFRQEAQAAANLSSPYIVNIYDWGQDQGTYFIVMEYVRGIDLKSAIRQRGAINQRKVAEIGSQICSALSVAHGYDIIHRDIKPQNIMVQPDGNIKVMDFGIARAGNSNLTQTSSVLGTAHYVSPEQAQGHTLAATSDLYSLGIVLYEAVTGKLPFDAPDAVSVAMKQVSEQPLPPSALNPELDPTLEAIILHAMEKDPAQRFPSAADMRNALNNYLTGRPVVLATADATSAATTVMGAAGYAPYTPAPVAGGTAVMPNVEGQTPVAGGSYGSDRGPIDYKRPGGRGRDDDPREDKGKKGIAIAIVAVLAVIIIVIAGAIGLSKCSSGTAGTVPDVTGMTKSKAESAIVKAGYVVGTETEASSDKVSSGYVISQTPAANTQADAGTKVDIVVSTGPEKAATVSVPDLSNMTESEAQAALTSAKLKYKAGTAQNSDTVEEGKVMSQNPSAGSTVDEGTTITYVLSKGKGKVDVPNVIGYTQSQAISTLEAKGLSVVVDETSDNATAGTVISQDTTGLVTAGTTVTITVSTGPEEVTTTTVPNLVGLTLDQIKQALTGTGLTLGSTTGDTSKVATKQDPAYGTTVDKGTTVNVTFPAAGNGNN